MHYIIYPDTLFLENFLCNLLFLIFLKNRFFSAITWNRVILTAGVTALLSTVAMLVWYPYSRISFIVIFFPVTGLIVCCFMKIRDRRRMLYLLYQMILWILVLGGVLKSIEQWNSPAIGQMILAVTCFVILFGILEKLLAVYERQNACMKEVVLYYDGRSCHFQGFADTGNQLMDPVSKQPVTIIAPDAWKELIKDVSPPVVYEIPYQALGTQAGVLEGTRIDFMVILEGTNSRVVERPVIAIADQPFMGLFQYSVLIHHHYC